MQRTLGWPVLALLVMGFAGSACSATPTACPGIGLGGPDLQVGVHQFAAAHPNGVRVTLCLAGRCSPTALVSPTTLASSIVGPTVTTPQPVAMTLKAIDVPSGHTLITLRKMITYTRFEPYGKGCGFQYRSYHTLTATGALIDAPPTSQPK